MKYRATIATLAAVLAFSCHLSAVTFDFQFDRTPSTPGVQPPIVGTGVFTFANDPGNGTFSFSALGAYSLNLSFIDGDTFNNANITSTLSEVKVVISQTGSTRRLQFSDTGAGSGGLLQGSLDLSKGSEELSFEPSYYGGGLQLFYEPGINTFPSGDYLATEAVPEVGNTFWLLAISALALALASTRRHLRQTGT